MKKGLKKSKKKIFKEFFTINLKQKAIEYYNIRVIKKDMKNRLNPKEIQNIDKDFLPQLIPEDAKLAQKRYSEDSFLFNEYFRGFSEETLKAMGELNITVKGIEKMINDLKKSIITSKKEYIVYRGVEGKFDISRFNASGGFISTSFDSAISKGYTKGNGEVVVIRVPKGTSIMYIRENSKYPNHMELLIPNEYRLKRESKSERDEFVVVKRNIEK